MTKAGTLAKVVHELLKNVPTEAGATLSRGQAETLAGLADIAAAVLAEARHDDNERAAVLADAGRASDSPVMIQDLEMLGLIMTSPENDIDIVNDCGAAYEYDVISTLYRQAKAAGYTDGQAIELIPAGAAIETKAEADAKARAQAAEKRAKAAEAKAQRQAATIEAALCHIEDSEPWPDDAPQTAAEIKQTLDEVYSILQTEA